jgi:hypothetical protein
MPLQEAVRKKKTQNLFKHAHFEGYNTKKNNI